MRVLLASASPRRRELMKKIFPVFDAVATEADESYRGETPADTVCEIAARKGAAAPAGYDIVIAADTLVCLNNRIYGKPRDRIEAKEMLKSLSGRTHEVVTGVYLRRGDETEVFSVSTSVEFYSKSEEEIEDYINRYDVMDKAGAYAVQDGVMVKAWQGSYDNVVGLPTERLKEALGQ